MIRSAHKVTSTHLKLKNNSLIVPLRWLRASDPANFCIETFQRTNVEVDDSGKILLPQHIPSCEISKYQIDNDKLTVYWSGEVKSSVYSINALEMMLKGHSLLQQQRQHKLPPQYGNQILWKGVDLCKNNFSCISMSYEETISSNQKIKALEILYKYGLLLVKGTPVNNKESANNAITNLSHVFGGFVGGPMKTLYGELWSTRKHDDVGDVVNESNNSATATSTADSSYGQSALPLHTDMTYIKNPPGIQIFCMCIPGSQGGESTFIDGFAVGESLREMDPVAFQALCDIHHQYQSIDKSLGIHLKTHGPVFSINKHHNNGAITQVRHNDLDRLPDILDPIYNTDEYGDVASVDDMYKLVEVSHRKLTRMLNDDTYRLVCNLQAGDTMIVANQRVLHGRHSFKIVRGTERLIRGAYITQDDFESQLRQADIIE